MDEQEDLWGGEWDGGREGGRARGKEGRREGKVSHQRLDKGEKKSMHQSPLQSFKRKKMPPCLKFMYLPLTCRQRQIPRGEAGYGRPPPKTVLTT
jgi:hypothetical protein